MEKIFVDTSAWFALSFHDDAMHAKALAVWHTLASCEARLVTSDWVFAETMNLVVRRQGIQAARRLGDRLLHNEALDWLFVQNDHLTEIWRVFHEAGRDGSVVDCASFVLMRQERIPSAFTFDKHFAQRGFHVLK